MQGKTEGCFQPAENNLPLKDKTLSPKKKKRKVNELFQNTNVETSLPLHAKRKKKKRFGVGAENREKAADLTITSSGISGRTKENHDFIDLTGQQNDQFDDKTPEWLTVQGIKLSCKSRDILMSSNGWLSDEHVDAAQRLLKSLKTGIDGLNDVVVMTHFQKTKVQIATKSCKTIQCHNIGGHWVVSTSVDGKVTLYESLSTGLNKTLLEQLVHLYQNFCVDGKLTVTVILQQLQNGLSDCGLFCIANATALTQGIDPTYVTWNQSRMREHLADCFESKQMKMFPHEVNNQRKQMKIYQLNV